MTYKSYTNKLYCIGAMGGEGRIVYILVLYHNEQKIYPIFHAFSQNEVDEFVAEFMR